MPFASAPYNFSRVILLPCIAARLGTSDRLHLARRGLAPRKKSQTYAGALTLKDEPPPNDDEPLDPGHNTKDWLFSSEEIPYPAFGVFFCGNDVYQSQQGKE
jgi:hypothetical protein